MLLAVTAALASQLPPSAAQAFSEPRFYGDSTLTGGGAGRWFTGSPADGYGCEVCHSGAYSLPLYQSGLPAGGYVPGKQYVVKLSWPEAAARAQLLMAANLHPSTSLVAEFVAEDGSPSGEVVIEGNHATPAELCTNTPPGTPPVLGGAVFTPVDDALPTESLSCNSQEKGQRCLLAVRPCGTSVLRFVWNAPKQWRGPIWFSAGFVTTDDASHAPNDFDNVTSLVIPMNAASDGALYESELDGGCSVRVARGNLRGAWFLPLMAAGLWLTRRRRALRIALAGSPARLPTSSETDRN